MGVAVFFGMLGVTFFGLFLTPVFYVLLRSLAGMKPLKGHGQSPTHDKTVPSYTSDAGNTVAPDEPADKARELAG
jgi:hypothetical protein